MKQTIPINYLGWNQLVDNITHYIDKFIKDGLIVLRNAYLTTEQQKTIQQLFGIHTQSWPNVYTKYESTPYIEDHKHRITSTGGLNESGKILLDWHIEHPYFDNPIVMGFWNMLVFNVEGEGGKTYFVNSTELLNSLSLEEQVFLNSCVIKQPEHHIPPSTWTQIKTWGITDITGPLIDKHWITQKPILRTFINTSWEDKYNSLYQVNNQNPTNSERKKFANLLQKLFYTFLHDDIFTWEHKWQAGDFVIVDLHTMIHAVTGGFTPEQRIFQGMWSYAKSIQDAPHRGFTPEDIKKRQEPIKNNETY